tara:strand:- start:780 stop:1673 length:894 start_codon:yes stop_codon:yes gene_type:complete
MKKKVVIWGHKNNGHTHGYIHSSYFKAFKFLGYDTYWFGDNDDVSGFNFDECIFLTEDQSQRNIPLNNTSKYILHHTKLDKYIDNGIDYINLANYLKGCDDGVSVNHKENSVEKINECCFWDEKTKTIYQPWGTDLTPNEIKEENALLYNPKQTNVHYVGMAHDNRVQINEFNESVNKNGSQFIISRGKSDKENMGLVRNSLVSVDIRGDWHIECGYLPCRIFKNISYGRVTGTNSPNVKKIMGDYVVYNPDTKKLFNSLMDFEENTNIEIIQESMNFIKNNHTYVNRVNNLMGILE